MPIAVFLSTVSDEFRDYRDQLVHDLTRADVAVKVQEDFKDTGFDTLDKLDAYIRRCDAVIHLVGDMVGAPARTDAQDALVAKYPKLLDRFAPLRDALDAGVVVSYTHWEAWLALYHEKSLMIAVAAPEAPRGPNHARSDAAVAAQAAHLKRLRSFGRYPTCTFRNVDDLAKSVALGHILTLLVEDYAKAEAEARQVAEGFIREMAKRVAGDTALNLDGMKRAVRNAIEIYVGEIAGRPVETNFDDIVNRALTRAKEQLDRGQSRLAGETLRNAARNAAEEMRREEGERRERFVASQTALYHRARDIALATHDGSAAASAVVELAQALHPNDLVARAGVLESESASLHEYWRERKSSVHLSAELSLRREILSLSKGSDNERRAKALVDNATSDLANALLTTDSDHNGVVALSLLREASMLIGGGDHPGALRKLNESKDLQDSDDSDNVLNRIFMQLECYHAIGDQAAVVNVSDQGIALCERWIENGKFNGGKAALRGEIKALIHENPVLTPQGFQAALSEGRLDYRLDQAELIVHWMRGHDFKRYRFDTVDVVNRCLEVLTNSEYNLLRTEAQYFLERSKVFRESKSFEYAEVFYKKYGELLARSKEIRERALRLILYLQKFIIGAEGDLDRKKAVFSSVLHCLNYAVSSGVAVKHRQIIDLIMGFSLIFNDDSTEKPSDNFYKDLGSAFEYYPPIPEDVLRRVVLYVDEMARLTGVPSFPDLTHGLLKQIIADD
jgi:hypothetical protein